MSGADYEEEFLQQKRKPLIVIEDDGEPFVDYVRRVFWKPIRKWVYIFTPIVIIAVLVLSGILDPFLRPDIPPSSGGYQDPFPWWFWWVIIYGGG